MEKDTHELNQNPETPVQQEPIDWKKELLSYIPWIVIPIVAVLLLNTFVGKIVLVQGTSMYPTLYDRDVLIVRSIAYEPEQGDIVIVNLGEENPLNHKYIVKRVIATEGQTVVIDYDANTVTVDGETLTEDYLNTSYGDVMMEGYYQNATYQVPAGCVFVMGDNRNNSTDSRSNLVGMVPVENITGGMVLDIPLGHRFGDNDNP